ncbi:MAG: DUF1361 domain-containing protein [Ruminococcaceae bacterium]|nr:DUF1361 domain-containing protein [Oscillospiraceae bacterium]
MTEKQKPKILSAHERRLMLALSILTLVLAATIPLLEYTPLHLSLLWNLFLAALPLLFAWLLVRRRAGKKQGALHRLLNGVLWALWLAFFPNAPYLVTDVIHISRFSYDEPGGVFTSSLQDWLGILHICAAIVVGCLLGCLSLYLLHQSIARCRGKWWGWGLCAGVAVLSGAGLYMGRVMRFNSWDILHQPLALLQQFFAQLSLHAILLMLLLSAMTLGMYMLFYLCFNAPVRKMASIIQDSNNNIE